MEMSKVTQMGLDAHRTFSTVTGRDAEGRVVCRHRLEHRNHPALLEDLRRWPAGTPLVSRGDTGSTQYRNVDREVGARMDRWTHREVRNRYTDEMRDGKG